MKRALHTLLPSFVVASASIAFAASLPPGAPIDATGRLPNTAMPLAYPEMRPVGTRTGIAGPLSTTSNNQVMAHTFHYVPGGSTALRLCYAGFATEPAEFAIPSSIYVASGATVAAGGSGYAVGDSIVSAATGGNRAMTLRVTQVLSGAVTKVAVEDGGLFMTQLADGTTQASTSGAGAGATFTYGWAPYAYAVRVGVEPVFSAGGTAAVTTGANAIRPAVAGPPRAVGNKLLPAADILVPSGGFVCTETIPVPVAAGGSPIGLRTWSYGTGMAMAAGTGSSNQTITALSESGTTATATVSSGTQELSVGRAILVAGATPTGYNGTWTITSIADASTFTFTPATAGLATATGTMSLTTFGQTYVSPGNNAADLSVSGTLPAAGMSSLAGALPAAILGNIYTPSVCLIGDSRTYGTSGANGLSDFPGDASENHGWLQRALGNKVPFVNFADPGNQLGYLMGSTYGRAGQIRAIKLMGCSTVGVILDVNDFGSGALSAAQLLVLEQQLAAELHAIPTVKRVFTATGTPDVTIAGGVQTANAGICANIEARNASLRTGLSASGTYAAGSASPYAGVYDFVLDPAAVVETGTTCQWTAITLTGDGLHPSSPVGHAAIAAGVSATILANVR